MWSRPSLATASPTLCGSSASSGPGSPVRTLQKAQARVQVSPMIIMVAWRLVQHSPMLGQPASSHTVCRPCSRTMARVSANSAVDDRHAHADPVRLAQHRRVGLVGLLGVARRPVVEDGDHGPILTGRARAGQTECALSSRNCAKRSIRDPAFGRAVRSWVPALAQARSAGMTAISKLQHHAAAHLAGQDVGGQGRDVGGRALDGHGGELGLVEVAGEAVPGLDARGPSAPSRSRCRPASRRAG